MHFLSDDTIVIVPLKRVKQIDNEVLREGGKCRVKWNDGVEYDATIQGYVTCIHTCLLSNSILVCI